MRARSAAAAALMLAVVAGTTASAHRRDELLQAARLAVSPGHVEIELDLTPGIAVAEREIANLDRDQNGTLSADEKRAYVGQVLGAIDLAVDGQPLQVQPIASSFPELDALRRGEGTIQLQLEAAVPGLSRGAHQLAYRNAHRRDISVYLANALVPESDRVVVKAQRRDPEQRDLTIEYVLRGGLDVARRDWLMGGMVGAALLAALVLRW